MKLSLVATVAALAAVSVCAYAQQGGRQANMPKPTKADAENVVQIVTTDKAKAKAYCDLTKLYDQVEAAEQKNDSDTSKRSPNKLMRWLLISVLNTPK